MCFPQAEAPTELNGLCGFDLFDWPIGFREEGK